MLKNHVKGKVFLFFAREKAKRHHFLTTQEMSELEKK